MLKYLVAAGVGAALAYFLDPVRGEQRREKARVRVATITLLGSGTVDEVARYTTNEAEELAARTAELDISWYTPDFVEAHTASAYTY
jgi:hypothetical protein